MQDAFFTGQIVDWQLVIPDFGTLTGPMQITELSWSGKHDGEAEFSVSLESAGQIQFGTI